MKDTSYHFHGLVAESSSMCTVSAPLCWRDLLHRGWGGGAVNSVPFGCYGQRVGCAAGRRGGGPWIGIAAYAGRSCAIHFAAGMRGGHTC